MPMTSDQAALAACHRQAAKEIAGNLSGGRDVAFLTLGDPTVYSTYMYIHKNIVRMGYAAEIIPGVPSFCAAAARLGVPLAEGGQALHVIPASYGGAEGGLELPGTKVFMKSGKAFVKMKEILEKTGRLRAAKAVQRCGMRQERVWQDMASADADASYFSIIIVKDEE
jgi:precorrin-2/cobalt-factor-2 C20-methyltransferase